MLTRVRITEAIQFVHGERTPMSKGKNITRSYIKEFN